MLLALALMAPASADQLVEGDVVRIHYDSNGTWNDTDAGAGFQVLHDSEWVDYAYAGRPFQMWRVGWTDGDTDSEAYALSEGPSDNVDIVEESDDSTSTHKVSTYIYETGDLEITKTEMWEVEGQIVRVHFLVRNVGDNTINDLRMLWMIDPDIDAGNYNTVNNSTDADGDGTDDLATSAGPSTARALAVGSCDPDATEVGHYGSWQSTRDVDVTLADDNGTTNDRAMAARVTVGDLEAGALAEMTLLVVVADSAEQAESDYLGAGDWCGVCDGDNDGALAEDCGGGDCDDEDPDAYPGADEQWYDGIDQDCSGGSDYDADGDGFDSDAYGGADCDDEDAAINPDAFDEPYDGEDPDCSGGSDYDADGDGYDSAGHGGDDCNDADPTVNPGAGEVWYDGEDQDCDGASDYDADQDGHDSDEHGGDDCDDFNSAAYPGAEEIADDNVDQDCDGVDLDGDGTGDPSKDDDIEIGKGGCNCSTPGAPSVGWLALGLVALMRRRRR